MPKRPPSPTRPSPTPPASSAWLKQLLRLVVPLLLTWWRQRSAPPERRRQSPSKRPSSSTTPRSKPRSGKPAARHTPCHGQSTDRGAGGKGGQGGRGGRVELPRRDAPPTKAKRRLLGSAVAKAFKQQRSDVILTDRGTVVHLLPDDREGSRHQRFLVEIARSDVTVKIAHNIDLAPRVPVSKGERIKFKGEYEYNELGGAVHWTHHDPKQWRDGGWIEHRGKRYE